MNFLYPAFLLGGLAIAIPIVLHFLRRDIAPPVPFSAVRLLRGSPVSRSRRRRLRDILLLVARVAALLLLAAAFARPYLAGSARGSTLRIVAVDRSFSMNAPGRFAHALDLARRAVNAATAGERVAVLAFDDHAETIAPAGPAADARAALDRMSPGFGATRYGDMFAKAAEIAVGEEARLIVVSDLQRSGWDGDERSVLPAGIDLELEDAGAPPANLSVASVGVVADRVSATVRNTGAKAHTGEIRIEHDGRPGASATYTVPADSTVDVSIPYRAPSAGSLVVSIDDAEGLPADNSRFAVLDPAPPQAVLLVTAGSSDSGYYVARALGALGGPDGDGMALRTVAARSLNDGALSDYSAVVLLATRGLDRRARESMAAYVRSGGGLLMAGSPDMEPAVVSAIFNWPPAMTGSIEIPASVALSPTDLRHPIFRPFGALAANLGQVRFARAWLLAADGWDVDARFTDGNAAVVERREGQGRVVLCASDLDRQWNDFPLHPAFVPFAVEAVRYVSGTRDRSRNYLVGAAPAGAGSQPGIYRVGPEKRPIAVNVDPRESSTAVFGSQEFTSMIGHVNANRSTAVEARAARLEARQSYWQYGLLLMLGALVAESFVGRA